jgi:hypothetical protein
VNQAWLVQRVEGVLAASARIVVDPLLVTDSWALAHMEATRRHDSNAPMCILGIVRCRLHRFPSDIGICDRQVSVVYRWIVRPGTCAHATIAPVCVVPDRASATDLVRPLADGVVTFAAPCPMRPGTEH